MNSPATTMRRALLFTAASSILASSLSAQSRPHSATTRAKHLPTTIRSTRGDTSLGRPILAGQPVTAQLRRTDPVLSDGSHYHRWLYAGRAGEHVKIVMTATAFSPYLYLARVAADGLRQIGESAGADAIEVDLPDDGQYVIVANAADKSDVGNYTLTVTSEGVPAVTDWNAVYPGGGDPSGRYALVVGINTYPDTNENLDGPADDARIMRDLLVDKLGFPAANVVLLTDSAANRDAIANAFLRHLGQAGPNGVAVFYYSGHGTQMDGNYALQPPLDPEPDGKDEALYVWGARHQATVLLDDELGFLADRLNAGRTLIILDACFSGTGTRGPSARRAKRVRFDRVKSTLAIPRHFFADAALATDSGVSRSPVPPPAARTADILGQPQRHVLLAASADSEVSWTASGWPKRGGKASVFTYFLADAIESADSSTTISGLMDRVRAQTVTYTRQKYREVQTPQTEGRSAGETLLKFLGRR